MNPMGAFMGGGQQPQQPTRGARTVQLSIGVDTRTNTLVVSANDALFRQVESLVQALDDSANQARRTMQVVSMRNANSAVVQQTLASLMGKVRTNAPPRTTRGPANGSAPADGKTPAATQTPAPTTTPAAETTTDANPAAQLLQQQMMWRMFQGGGGGFGGGGRGAGFRGGNNGGGR
jgi:type II secretory pathway component GspD/PulD (secretin)